MSVNKEFWERHAKSWQASGFSWLCSVMHHLYDARFESWRGNQEAAKSHMKKGWECLEHSSRSYSNKEKCLKNAAKADS